jgi:thiol-disulfide isomerase/thioredoxin
VTFPRPAKNGGVSAPLPSRGVCTGAIARATGFDVPIGRVLFISLLALLTACESGKPPEPSSVAPPAKPTPAVAPVAAAAQPVATAAAAPAAPDPHSVEFRGNIDWHTWSDALGIAARESKPIMVLVYADWCPHCRALGPVFSDPAVEALAKHFVMVRQNNDEDPAWLEPYNQQYGGYVPRIFFFDSKGKMRVDVTSGHPRYPYFYAAEAPEFLKKSMQRVIGS